NIRRALVKGVEDWAPVHNRGLVNTDPRWKKMNEIVRQADRDEWRSQIRTASQSGDRQAWEKATRVRTSEEIGDRQALEKLADAIPMRDVAPTTLRLLGSSLLKVGAEEKGLSVLREAQRQYPDDLWTNVALARGSAMVPGWANPLRVDAVQAVTSL